jgi:ubiquinone biosynthesis protein
VNSSTFVNFLTGAVIDIPILAYAARRLLGVRRFSLTRTVIAGVIGILGGSAIINALASGLTEPSKHVGPVLGFLGLGVASALLLSMAILVIWQALIPAGTVPSPSSWPRRLRARARRTRRYWQIVRIFTRAGLGPLLRSGPALRNNAALAHSLSAALDRSGVVFVKFGQALSTRRDLLPPEFTAELARLQDRVSPLSWPDVERILREEHLDGAFAEIDREPLASASIAQVHTARLRTGEQVVVKVRRPDVPALAERDLDIIARLARRMELRAAWARTLGVVKLAEGFAAALREELDFRVELRNLESVSATDGVVIPHACPDLSSQRVLVMQRLDGIGISKAPLTGLDRERLAGDLLGTLLRQIVIDGIFHADPHPGNILLLADGRLGLIDFGSVGRLDSELRSALERLLLALDRRDPVALTDALLEVTARPDELDQQALERAVGALLMRLHGADAAMFAELFRVVARYRLEVPSEFAAVFRALSTLEGCLTALSPGFDIVTEAERFGRSQLGAPASVKAALSDEAMALLPMLRRLPRRFDRITAAVEGGRLNVNVRLLADERDRNTVTGWLHQLMITVLAATAGLMAVVLLAIKDGPVMTPTVSLYQFLGYCLLVVCSLLALRVLASVFRAELPVSGYLRWTMRLPVLDAATCAG